MKRMSTLHSATSPKPPMSDFPKTPNQAALPARRAPLAALLLAMAAFFAVALAVPAQAWAMDGYNLFVAGARITDDSPADVFGDGTVLYDAGTGTLTLENFVATGEDSGYIGGMLYASNIDLTLVLRGENALVGGDGGIHVDDCLTITGDGTLAVSSGNCPDNYTTAGIHAYALTVDEGFTGTLVATGGNALDGSYGIECNTLAINGGTVIATGGTAGSSAGVCVTESSAIGGGMLYAQGGNATSGCSAGILGADAPRPTVAIDGGVLVARAGLVNGTLDPDSRGAFWAAEYSVGENMKVAGEVGYDDGSFYGRDHHENAGDPPVGMAFVPTSWTATTAADLPSQLTGNVYCVGTTNAGSTAIAEIEELDTNGYTALFVRLFEDSSIGGTGLQFRNSVTISGAGALIGIGGNCPGNSYSMGLSFNSSLALNGAALIGASASCAAGDAIGVSASGSATIADGAIVGVGGTSSKTSKGVSFGGSTEVGGASAVVGVGGTSTSDSAGILCPYSNEFTLADGADMLAAGGLSSSSNSYGIGQTCFEYVPEFEAGSHLAALGGCAPTGTSMGISTSTKYSGGKHYCEEGCTIVALGGIGAYSYGNSARFYEITLDGDMTVAGRTRAFERAGDTYEDEIWIGSECTLTGYENYAGIGEGTSTAGNCKYSDLAGYKRLVLKHAVAYPLWIAGTQVTEGNLDSLAELEGVTVADGGHLAFDPETNTLVLDNVAITNVSTSTGWEYHEKAGIYAEIPLNIEVKGACSASGREDQGPSYGIYLGGEEHALVVTLAEGSVLTSRGATLTSGGESIGIYCEDDLVIAGSGMLDAIGGETNGFAQESIGIYSHRGSITLNGSPTVTATGSAAVGGYTSTGVWLQGKTSDDSLTINGGSLTAVGIGGGSQYSYGVYVYQGGVTVAGGELVAMGGTLGPGIFGDYDDSYGVEANFIEITGGKVTASTTATVGEDVSALSVAPSVLEVGPAGASVNADGSGAVVYVAKDNATYRWFKTPFAHTVSFDAAGGAGEMPAAEVGHGEKYVLPVCGFAAPKCKAFSRWDKGAAGTEITVTADTKLVAQWKGAHTLVAVPEVPPTTKKAGTQAYWRCTECGKLFSDAGGKNEIAAPVVLALGEDGTECGKGASEAVVDLALTTAKAPEKDQKGTVYGLLQAKVSKATNKSLKLAWSKVSGAKKYVVYGSACGKTSKLVRLLTTSKTSNVFKKVAGKAVKKGTYYKFTVVALNKSGKVVSTSKIAHAATTGGKVGNAKAVKTAAKKGAVSLKAKKKFSLKAKVVPANAKLKIRVHRAIAYESSNPKVAAVSAKGVITAKKKGTCFVYAYSQNGIAAKVKVTVK